MILLSIFMFTIGLIAGVILAPRLKSSFYKAIGGGT